MLTYQQALLETSARLRDAGSSTPELDAMLLLVKATGKNKIHLYTYPKMSINNEVYNIFEELVGRREKAEPMAYILGEKEFWDITLQVNSGVLIPRPDTEILVEAVLENIADKNKPLKICDLGTGSGAIVLSLLNSLPNATAIGADISDTALTCATNNSKTIGLADRVRFINSCWFDNIAENGFDIIVSNPPYIPSADMAGLMRDVIHYEPSLALDGGDDGLTAYREIIKSAPDKLVVDGFLGLEVGVNQADDVANLMKQSGNWHNIKTHKDLAGIERVVCGYSK